MSRVPLLLTLLAAAPLASAQHAHHHGHDPAPTPAPVTVDPHAGHAMVADPHAGHAKATDPHAEHTLPADPHAGHVKTADPHLGHDKHADPHAGHDLPLTPIPVPSAADRAAAFPALHAHSMQHAGDTHHLLRAERLEGWDNAHGSGQAWEVRGWWGSDTRRAWLRAEGERDNGRSNGHIDLLYGQATGPWWEAVAGLRQEHGDLSRTRAAIGLQGLAPYRLETQATLVLGGAPHAELEVAVEHEVLLTNRLILTPALEASALLRDDPDTARARGLASVEAGLRLRYEVTRRFAPYLGVEHERLIGRSADLARENAHAARHTRWVAGLRFWF